MRGRGMITLGAVAALALASGAMPALAQTTTVDFSGYAAGGPIGNTYASLGLAFSSSAVFGACQTGGCPSSDVNGAFAYAYGAPFSAYFSVAQTSVSFQSASFGTANGFASSIFAQAYDSNGNAVGSGVTVNDYGQDDSIYTLSGADIARVDFGYGHGTNGPAIANLTFQAPAAVPEPGAWIAMIVGFGAIGATMRQRRTSVAFQPR